MDIRKTVTETITKQRTNSTVQPLGDCNEQVAQLFTSKPELDTVTLIFGNGDSKQYQRV